MLLPSMLYLTAVLLGHCFEKATALVLQPGAAWPRHAGTRAGE